MSTPFTRVIEHASFGVRLYEQQPTPDVNLLFSFQQDVTTIEELYAALEACGRQLRAAFPLARVRQHHER
jgi:hypothetical protein